VEFQAGALAAEKPVAGPKPPGPTGGSGENIFLTPELNPRWKWTRATEANAATFWRRVARPALRQLAPRGRCLLVDACVAADGTCYVLGQALLYYMDDDAGGQSLGPLCPVLLRTRDGGTSYEELPRAVWPVAAAKSDPKVLYGLAGPRMLRSDDGGATWREVCADLQLLAVHGDPMPDAWFAPPASVLTAARAKVGAGKAAPSEELDMHTSLTPPVRALVLYALTAAIQVDPFNPDHILLGLRSTPREQDLRTPMPYPGGFTGPGAPNEWRESSDGGKTWHHRLYEVQIENRSALVGAREAAGTVQHEPQRIGLTTVSVLKTGGRLVLAGGVWFSPTARDTLYWADNQPGPEPGPRNEPWWQAGRYLKQPWQGVMTSASGGQSWKQVGPKCVAGQKVYGLDPNHQTTYQTLPLVRPGVRGGREALFALAGLEAGFPPVRRLVFYWYDGAWHDKLLFSLSEPNTRFPEPLALLVSPDGTAIYVPLKSGGTGTITQPDGKALPASFSGILVSPDGGDSWHLYDATTVSDDEIIGPDGGGVLWAQSTVSDAELWVSQPPGAAPAPTPRPPTVQPPPPPTAEKPYVLETTC
jgi:hypothetical protein